MLKNFKIPEIPKTPPKLHGILGGETKLFRKFCQDKNDAMGAVSNLCLDDHKW